LIHEECAGHEAALRLVKQAEKEKLEALFLKQEKKSRRHVK